MSNEWASPHLWTSGGGVMVVPTVDYLQVLNTTAETFDVEFMYYAGPLFSTITYLTDYTPISGKPPMSIHVHGDPDSANPIITTYYFTPGASTITEYGADMLTWTDVTSKVYYRGTFTSEWDDNSIIWSVSLSGQDYSDAYFGKGRAILCLRRIYNGGWQPWETDWLGQITEGHYTSDYRIGEQWTREITGLNATLAKANAPRIVLGKLNMATTEQASVQVSSTLATPAVETGNGEFVGATANVDPDNSIDENINTVWISQDPPTVTADTLVTTVGDLRIDEVFLMPASGWSIDETWWFELVNTYATGGSDIDLVTTLQNGIVNQDGVKLCFKYSGTADDPNDQIPSGQYILAPGERGIVCANKDVFDAYTGGGSTAKWVIEAKSWGTKTGSCIANEPYTRFRLNNQAGSLQLYGYYNTPFETVVWNRTGNTPYFHRKTLAANYTSPATTMVLNNLQNWDQTATVNRNGYITDGTNSETFYYNDSSGTTISGVSGITNNYAQGASVYTYGTTMSWSGGAVNLNTINGGNAIVAGQSIKRFPSGTDNATNANWTVDSFPTPASIHTPNSYQWAIIDLGAIESQLDQDTQPGDATLTLTDTTGWFNPNGGTAQGIIYNQGDIFSYSGRTATTLTGVQGIEGAYYKGEAVYPYEPANPNGRLTQTGWPLSQISVSRLPSVSAIEKIRIYLSSADTPMTPDESTWAVVKTDWEDSYFSSDQAGWRGRGGYPLVHSATWYLESGSTPPRRARHILIIIDRMSDDGRAKINNVEALLSQSALNLSGVGNLDDTRAGELARYILVNYKGLHNNDISVNTPGGQLSTFAIAIAPYTTVLNDLARSTGALIRYGLYQSPVDDTTMAINWESDPWWPDTDDFHEPLYTFTTASIRGKVETSDRQVDFDSVAVNATDPDRTQIWRQVYPPASSGDIVRELSDYVVADETTAWMLAQMAFRRESSTQTATLRVKGVGEWCMAGQWIALTWDLDGDGTAETTNWVIERATRVWDWLAGGDKSWETRLELRRYWS